MVLLDSTPVDSSGYSKLYFMDGTSSKQSYAAVARRGSIFLGVRFVGLDDGTEFGMPDRTYVRFRIRSAWSAELAEQFTLPDQTVVEFFPSN